MKIQEKNDIRDFASFVDVFISLYGLKYHDSKNYIIFSKNFKENLKGVFNINNNFELGEKFNLFDNNCEFNIESFVVNFNSSSMRKLCSIPLYDLMHDNIRIKVNLKSANNIFNLYKVSEISIVSKIVEDFHDEDLEDVLCYDFLNKKVKKRNYIGLN